VNLEGALTWAFTFVGQPWFAGYRQLATDRVDLPVLNVFRLFSRLGTIQLAATSSEQVPLERILSNGVRDKPDVGVLATRSERGRVDILLWHYHDDDVPGPPADIHLQLTGLAPGIQLQARIWRIDRENGNAFTAWKAMGSPPDPTKSQIAHLISASHMPVRRIHLPSLHGSAILERHLPRQGVELIELEWPATLD
jgi:xylan 1,4-beta-xylosidase